MNKRNNDNIQKVQLYESYIELLPIMRRSTTYIERKINIRKDIPVQLSNEEIIDYVDFYNYGGIVTKIGENDEWIFYIVKVYID